MIKNIIFITTIFFFIINNSHAKTELYIYATVNNQIITNYDIKKEALYLKILNPGLAKISENKIFQISKESLINEIIKLNEIKKIFDIKDENPFVNDYLKQLYTKLNFNSETEFETSLSVSKNYSLSEIKQKLKIEILWNELIYLKYNNQVKIDKEKLMKKINNLDESTRKEYFLSEIVFEKKRDIDFKKYSKEIIKSIEQVGFNNTANIYSISDSAKLGGKIGWVDENNLSEIIYQEIKNLTEGQFTDVIQVGNNYLILKIEKIKLNKISINKKQELNKMIKFETNKQLNQFSKIYFDKSKINYTINEM